MLPMAASSAVVLDSVGMAQLSAAAAANAAAAAGSNAAAVMDSSTINALLGLAQAAQGLFRFVLFFAMRQQLPGKQ